MLRLRNELVQEAFAPLMERGFSEPEWWLAGSDQMVTFRRDGVEVHLVSEDMGQNLPFAYIRQRDGSMVYLVDESEYPMYHSGGLLKALTFFPWRGRSRLRAELQGELETRVWRLAALAEAHIVSLPHRVILSEQSESKDLS